MKGDNAMSYTSDNSGRDRDDYHPDRWDCWYFDTRRRHKGQKNGDSYENGASRPSKTTTVTRMATSRGSIPVTVVGTFET